MPIRFPARTIEGTRRVTRNLEDGPFTTSLSERVFTISFSEVAECPRRELG
jgi:hypothetical protein